ncbi:MAG: VOC family protein [Rubrivivax sp.]|nr:VOC family protein [Rubrivivax sp.]
MLLSLGHVTVRSADFDRTEHFYCTLLGLRPGPRPAIALPGRWFYLGDEAVVHVLPSEGGAGQGSPGIAVDSGHSGPIDHFALNADDRPAFEQRLRAAGQPFESRRLADSDTWQIFLIDPDGARVELSFAGERTS